MTKELKPCAHCGGVADLIDLDAGAQVMCSGCDVGLISDDWMAEKAIEIWNTRTDPGWISVDERPVNDTYNWSVGDKAIAWGGYAFEIEWDGDIWCSIGGDDFTHWMPLPEPPKE